MINQEKSFEFWLHIFSSIPAWIKKCEMTRTNEIIVEIDSSKVLEFFDYIQNHTHLQMKMLVDLTVVDFPLREKRFEVIYNLLSLTYNTRLRVKVLVDDRTSVPSVGGLYSSANWFEREAWDMFGIYFSNHPDLRRILTDYGFEGFPLRKDFPLSGYLEVRYDESEKRVLLESLDTTQMTQDFRFFEFSNIWNSTSDK